MRGGELLAEAAKDVPGVFARWVFMRWALVGRILAKVAPGAVVVALWGTRIAALLGWGNV